MSSEYSEEYVNIETPENVAFGYKVAGIGSRFLAAIVDTLIIIGLEIVVVLTLILIVNLFFESLLNSGSPWLAWMLAMLGLIAFAFFWGYYILFEMLWNGQSIGKRWVGLRVIKTDGTPITLTESIVRNLIRLVDFLPAYYGVGVVTMFINDQSRRLGDLAAGTLVVHDRPTLALESLAVKPTMPAVTASASSAVTALPVERLTEREIQMAEDFLRRQNELANRQPLATRILERLFDKMALPAAEVGNWLGTTLSPEQIIAAIVKASRERETPDTL